MTFITFYIALFCAVPTNHEKFQMHDLDPIGIMTIRCERAFRECLYIEGNLQNCKANAVAWKHRMTEDEVLEAYE